MIVKCPRCPAEWGGLRTGWGGLRTGHCATCHETFTGITAFDLHRSGSYVTGRKCLPPEEVGLTDAGRAYPCWTIPGTDEPEEDGQL